MAGSRSLEIVCAACGRETLVRREPVYDGFRKTGERFVCVSCGHAYSAESEVPFKEKPVVRVFSEADRPKPVEVFEAGEGRAVCGHCLHYVVNPFTQRCGLRFKTVQATDTCADFAPQLPKKQA